jgi:hypothetical protein
VGNFIFCIDISFVYDDIFKSYVKFYNDFKWIHSTWYLSTIRKNCENQLCNYVRSFLFFCPLFLILLVLDSARVEMRKKALDFLLFAIVWGYIGLSAYCCACHIRKEWSHERRWRKRFLEKFF